MSRTRATTLALGMLGLGVLLASACAEAVPGRASSGSTSIGVADRANDYVSIATDGSSVALTWAASSDAGGTDVFAAMSEDGGASFAAPVRVNSVEAQASVNVEQPPRIVFVRSGSGARGMVVLWTARGAAGTLLLSARSEDGGRTFGPSVTVPGTDAAGNRGWESLAADPDGRLLAVWLDHRDTAMTPADHAMHVHGGAAASAPADGVARAQRSQLFVGALDGSLEPRGIARGVCYCCKTTVAAGPDGAVYTAWRHVYEGNRRDIAFAMSSDGGRSFADPVRVSEDDWQIDGCPENGPALAVDARKRVYVIWPTLVRDGGRETLKLFLASTADGRTFTSRTALPTVDPAYHPQLAVAPDGTLIAAWDELTTAGRRVKLARGRPDNAGSVRFTVATLGEGTAASHPALAVTPSGIVAAWTSGAGPRTRVVVSRLPL